MPTSRDSFCILTAGISTVSGSINCKAAGLKLSLAFGDFHSLLGSVGCVTAQELEPKLERGSASCGALTSVLRSPRMST